MRNLDAFYIDGKWVQPRGTAYAEIINPANELVSGRIALATPDDVDQAVTAARRAFLTWSQSTREQRIDLLCAIEAEYVQRVDELGDAVTEEMGAPRGFAGQMHVGLGIWHLQATIEILKHFPFEERRGATLIRREPIGVCGLITPWNWPINQIAVKIFPALATGCTAVLKPAQASPYSAQILAEILHAAGTPAGVFNLVQGKGSVIGTALSRHTDVDMISFTGSEEVGVQIQKDAAETVKRVGLELGGKSAWIVLDDEELPANVASATAGMMNNSGQTCSAGSRLLVPASRVEEALTAARTAADNVSVGNPLGNFSMGPVVSRSQFEVIQAYIAKGIEQGATLVAGGLGRPDGIDSGFYVRPTVFHGDNNMTIAREEIFGPVLTVISYNDIDDAIAIANDSNFGLGGYVTGVDETAALEIAQRLRTGSVRINGGFDIMAPFGGYKRSGNGREWGEFGFHEFLETKAIVTAASIG